MSQLKEQKKFHAAEQLKKLKQYQKATEHKKPVTRREFLGSGLLGFSGTLFLPSVLDLILQTKVAQAQVVCDTPRSGRIPFINVNLSGGWSAVTNWVPRDRNGQMLTSYSEMGLGTAPATVNAFGNNALFSQNSDTNGFLAGIKATAAATTINNTAFVGVPVRSGDDRSENPFDIGGMISKAGLAGTKLPNLGSRANTTGVGQRPAFNVYPATPLRVDRVTDAINAIGFSGALATLSLAQQESMLRMVKNLSESQARKLASLSGGENLADIVQCATDKNLANLSAGAADVDPRNNASLATLWNFGSQSELAKATIAMNAISGTAGAGGIELGGYDYHGNARTETDSRDRQAGETVGRILQTAAVLGKPVFLYLTSDGAVRSETSTSIADFVGDSGERGAALMFAYNPTGAPRTNGTQLGAFTNGQAADTYLPTGGNPEMAAAAVFANWCALNNDMAAFERTLRNPFTTEQMTQILKFG